MKRFTILLIALLCLMAPIYAMGATEYGEYDNLVRVVEVQKAEEGYAILAVDANGEEIVYKADGETITDIALDRIDTGDVLNVRNNGIMTMSLPPQAYAVQIKDFNLAYEQGFTGQTLPESVEIAGGEREVELVSIEEHDGHLDLVVEDKADGELIIYHTSEETLWDAEPELLEEGDTLFIQDDGKAMLSLPVQMNAVSIFLPLTTGEVRTVKTHSTEEIDGERWINAEDADGQIIRYRIDADTIVEGDLASVDAGTLLEITDNGRMTRSIPPQTTAVKIVILTDRIANGDALPFNMDSLISRFGYAYGYQMMDSFISQNLIVDGAYFTRGCYDILDLREDLLLTPDEIIAVINDYIPNYHAKGILGTAGEKMTEEEILALPVPETIEQKFAYAWGYFQTFNTLGQGVDLDRASYPYGFQTRLYEDEPLLDADGIKATFDEYFDYKEKVFDQWIEEVTVRNLEDANKTLASQKEVEGAIVLSDQLVLIPQIKNENPGAKPVATDTVEVNYALHDLDGRLLDQGTNARFPLQNLIPGFRDACLAMHVGDAVTAFVHPDIGYGAAGNQAILPNSLLIFDIELVGIVTE